MSTVETRQTTYLEMAVQHKPDRGTAIPFLHAGRIEDAVATLRRDLDHCIRHVDCTDFRFNSLLRALFLYRDRIPADLQQEIKAVLLNGRFYGGHRPEYPMFYNSENHCMTWYTTEYLTAQLFPDETFTFDGRSARTHRNRARAMIGWWIDQRARWGYSEWNSAVYMGVNINSLINLADFSNEAVIRRLAKDSLTKLFADLAADSLDGKVWSAQCRMYEGPLLHPETQGVRPVFTILLGLGDPASPNLCSSTSDFIATSSYRPPAWLRTLAADTSTPLVNREYIRETPHLIYSFRGVFWRLPYEMTDDEIMQRDFRADIDFAPILTERRAEYLLSAMLNPKMHNFQMMVWMCSLQGKVAIFSTHPTATPREVHGPNDKRHEYWAGTCTVPRCYLKNGVLAALYKTQSPDAKVRGADFTHAWFPTDAFDEWQQADRWFFARLGNAYAGLFAPAGAALVQTGEWAGKDIKAPGQDALWVCVCGSEAQDRSFKQFQDRCLAAAVKHDIAASSADIRVGETAFSLSYADGPSEDGKPVRFEDWAHMDNAIVHVDAGSPLMKITTARGEKTLDFSKARVLLEKWQRRD